MKRYVIRRRGLVLDKEVWRTWVLECDDTITQDVVEAILEETYDFPGDVYRYTSEEVKSSRNWTEVIDGVPLIKLERTANGYDLWHQASEDQAVEPAIDATESKRSDTPETTDNIISDAEFLDELR